MRTSNSLRMARILAALCVYSRGTVTETAIVQQVDSEPAEPQEQRVTPLELFLDLVFVLAITQVTGYVSHDPTWTRLVEGLAILAVAWWVWSAYAWLGNTAGSDEGIARVVLMAAAAGMLIASLAVPHAFGSDALIFGIAIFAVRTIHLGAYSLIARSRGDTDLVAVVSGLAQSVLPASILLVIAGTQDGTTQAALWAAALTVDYGGLAVRGTRGWSVQAGHFAERHGLIIIIALGESVVSLGVASTALELTAGVVTAALLGIAVVGAMWWAYFDVVALVAERRLRAAAPHDRVLMARDSYTYLHLPMVAGIVVFAVGVKLTLADPSADLESVGAVALCGGPALYLLALSAFKRRNIGSFNYPRLVATAVLIALAPLATVLPALLSLALVTTVMIALIGYEVARYAAARDRIRHAA
jgi:low temperature requirement protein LtrA